jgi:hypothetical protein
MEPNVLIALIGLFVGLGGLVVAICTVRHNTKSVKAQFWLALRNDIAKHVEVHSKLRPGGDWCKPNAGPDTAAEWIQIEAYMGLFELCEVLLSQDLIDAATFSVQYEYRLKNILKNDRIVKKKLDDEYEFWTTFIKLVERLNIEDSSSLKWPGKK